MGERRANRERDVLDVAATLFCARGFSATTVDDIAAAAGLNKAMLYYYFGSKAGILYRLYMETIDEMVALLDEDDPKVSADEALAKIVRAIVTEVTRRPDYVNVFFQELQWLDKWLPAEEYQTVRKRQAVLVAHLEKIIERGSAAGTFRPIDAALAASGVLGMVGWMYQWHRGSGRRTPEEMAGFFVEFALRGLTASGGQASPRARSRGSRRP